MGRWNGLAIMCSVGLACGGALPEPEQLVLEEPIPEESGTADSEAGEQAGAGEVSGMWSSSKLGPPYLLRNFPPPVTPGFRGITELVDVGGTLFFGVNPEAGGPSLWRSDGTVAGTVRVRQFPAVAGATVRGLTVLGDRLFFVADDGEHGAEPWISDGTAAGTHLLRDVSPGPDSSLVEEPAAVGETLFFVRTLPGTEVHEELWKSDGTEAGTVLVKDLGTVATGGIAIGLTNFGGVLFFSGLDPEHGREPWTSDGTEAGTRMVRDIFPGPESSFPNFPVFVGAGVSYFAATEPVHGRELWRTDGTELGTVLVEDIVPGPAGSRPRPFTVFKDWLYFTSSESPDGALRLRKLKPGRRRSEVITDIPNPFGPGAPAPLEPLVVNSTEADGQLFMTVFFPGLTSPTPRDVQLWRTNGTRSGTRLLHRPLFISASFRPPNLIPVGDRILFTGFSEETGDELWVSDGSVRGTRLLHDFLPGPTSSAPLFLTRSDGYVFFVNLGFDGGEQLWALPFGKRRCLDVDTGTAR
uniref:Hyalin repeat protein n=1 Tax=Archangium gephyra TaxID=48 RepID=A0A3Q8I1F7_9BACT|nr:hyalin repeat protein [Archangium gephyra]